MPDPIGICVVNTYLHDGTPEGFLTALRHAHSHDDTEVDIPATGRTQPGLFSVPHHLESDPTQARALLDKLAGQHGAEVSRRLMYLYYSESSDAGALALAYLRLLDRHGKDVDQHHAHPAIQSLHHICQKVGREIHRFKGLLRFTEVDPPALQALMEPDYNILMAVTGYFRRRLGGQPWLIVDVRRQRAAHWDTRQLSFLDAALEPAGRSSPDEMARLWQTFYRSVAIPDRKNESLRRQHMPERYWKYLSEL